MNDILTLLLSRAREGDEESMAQLLEKYRPMLEHAAGRSHASLGDAGISYEDLLQEARFALSRAVAAYSPDRGVTFGAYARTCVNNRLISIARKVFSSRSHGKSAPRVSTPVPPTGSSLDSLIESLGLTAYERQVVTLRLHGYKPADIAAALDRPVKSVYNAICRIKAKASGIEL